MTTPHQIEHRIRANNDWLAQCKNMHRDECQRIGKAARDWRESKNLSLREVAAAMKISAPFLSDLERGNRLWTEGTLRLWQSAVWTEADHMRALRAALRHKPKLSGKIGG